MAAGIFGLPELLLDDDEAKKLGGSVERVLSLYQTEVNPATLAWMSLVFAIVMVYGPRFYAIRNRMKQEAGAGAQPQQQPKVTVFPGQQARAAAPPQPPAAEPAAAQPAPPEQQQGPTGTPQDLFGIGYSAAIAEAL